MKLIYSVTSLFFIIVVAIFPYWIARASQTDGTIDSAYKYAWSENTGWINFGASGGNVHVADSGLTGYAWSGNYGWINLNATTSGVINNNEGTLSGYAWGEQTGWIDFSGVTINYAGEFAGYASGTIAGRVNFNCSNTSSCSSSDFKVKTDWRPLSVRNSACGDSIDNDSDGLTDYPADSGCSSATDNDETNASPGNSGGGGGGAIQSWVFSQPPTPITSATATQPVTTHVIQPSAASVNNLIRVEGDPRVYVVINNFKRHIPSPEVFDSYGYKWSDIKTVSASEFAKYQITTLMRTQGDPKVYAIENGARKWITSPEEFNAKGYQWDAIVEVSSVEIAAYREANATVPTATITGKLTMELQFGMRNNQVRLLQEFLAKDRTIYPEGKITGYFGPATRAAVRIFQAKYGIRQVGRVGPATMAKLNELMR